MRAEQRSISLNIPAGNRMRSPRNACGGEWPAAAAGKPVILLVSDDVRVGESLLRAVEQAGRMVVKAKGLEKALEEVHRAQPAEAGCPPVILLTGRRGQFGPSTASRAGPLADKSDCLEKLLEAVEQTLALPALNLAERNSIQRIVIRWLRPCEWSVPVTPGYQHWGS